MKKEMKSGSIKNTSRNIVWGVVNRIFAFLIPFVMRTVLIHVLGSEYPGLDSLFTSILQMLNIAELGFSAAVVFSMYKPIAQGDQDRICALLNLYRKAYRIIGAIILTAGLLLTPFLPLLIKGDIPSDLNLYFLYFIFLGNTVIGYWMSAYLGLLQVTIYGNYYTILYGVHTLLECITKAMAASVGNKIVVSDTEKNHADMMRFTFMYMWIASICTVCLLVIFQPFMRLWMGDGLMLPDSAMILLCVYLYVLCMGDVRSVYVTSAGLWWEGRFRSAAEAVANIVLNILLGKYFGISGIIAATILSLLVVDFGYGTTIIYRHYFKNDKLRLFYLKHFVYAIVTAATAFIVYRICNLLPGSGLPGIFVKGVTAFILGNLCLLAAYHRTEHFRDALRFARNIVD